MFSSLPVYGWPAVGSRDECMPGKGIGLHTYAFCTKRHAATPAPTALAMGQKINVSAKILMDTRIYKQTIGIKTSLILTKRDTVGSREIQDLQ